MGGACTVPHVYSTTRVQYHTCTVPHTKQQTKVTHPFGFKNRKERADLEELIVDVRAALELTIRNRV